MIKRTCDVCGKEIREEDGNYGRGFFFVNTDLPLAAVGGHPGLKLRVHLESIRGEYRMERDVCIACVEDCLNNGDLSAPVIDAGDIFDRAKAARNTLGPDVRPGKEAFVNHFDCVVRDHLIKKG